MKYLLPVYFCCSLLANAESPAAKITNTEDGWKFHDENKIIHCTGHLCLQSEGPLIQSRNLRIRELP
jgi:hypothetical protein